MHRRFMSSNICRNKSRLCKVPSLKLQNLWRKSNLFRSSRWFLPLIIFKLNIILILMSLNHYFFNLLKEMYSMSLKMFLMCLAIFRYYRMHFLLVSLQIILFISMYKWYMWIRIFLFYLKVSSLSPLVLRVFIF